MVGRPFIQWLIAMIRGNAQHASAFPAVEDEVLSGISLGGILEYLRNARRWIVVAALLGILGGGIAYLLMTKIYRAEVSLTAAHVDHGAGGLSAMSEGLGGLASLAGLGSGGGSSSRTESLAVLKSPGFVRRFIQQRNLMPVLYGKNWDAGRRADFSLWGAPTLEKGVVLFSTRVMSIKDDRKTGLVTLAIEWRDRNIAAQWANALVNDLNSDLRLRAVADSNGNIAYLRGQLQRGSLPEAEQQILFQLVGSQMVTAMAANVRKQYAFKVLDWASPPDPDDFIRPNMVMLMVLGALGAVFASLLIRGLTAAVLTRRRAP